MGFAEQPSPLHAAFFFPLAMPNFPMSVTGMEMASNDEPTPDPIAV